MCKTSRRPPVTTPLANQPSLTSSPTTSQRDPTSTVPSQPVSTGTPQTMPISTPQTPPLASRPSTSSAPRMERMKFPKFSGDIRDYKRFKELFNHCAVDLTEIECFFQLTESMTNPKEYNKIKGCINVERAWQVLDECYGDEDKVVDRLLKDLENLKPYENKGNINLPAMSRFVQTLQIFETQAETVGLSGELNSKIMLSQIKQKLPEDHRIAYYKSVRDDHTDDSLTGLVKWLYSQLLLLEKAKPISVDNASYVPTTQRRMSRSSNAATVNAGEWSQRSKINKFGVPKCALHINANTHFLKTCNKFRDLPMKEKYEIMRKNNICYRCGHNNCIAGKSPFDLNSCQFVAPCRIAACGSDSHFGAICPVAYGKKDSGYSSQLSSNAEPFRPISSSANASTITKEKRVKLQGTLPTVMGYLRCGNIRRLVRILLDGGSQTTLLRKGIFPRADQDVYQDHELSVVGGGKFTRKLRLLDCLIADVGGNWSHPLSVTEIDKPCADTPIVLQEQLQQHDHLRNVDIHAALQKPLMFFWALIIHI
ncbi:hypothetical protein BSL78_13611 [Apostichopus japonicus]|uniref:Uncharacterized protein n=1 Tax=Stichopus japonicus TaxID=307972 RepID=A0A2G8KNA7_STIJA|nr:hypothetical protein BSL78_13611 [Apostichopus japonicus]